VLRTIAAALLSIQKKIKKNGTVSPLPPTFPLPHSYSFLFLYVLLGQQQPLKKKNKKTKKTKKKKMPIYMFCWDSSTATKNFILSGTAGKQHNLVNSLN